MKQKCITHNRSLNQDNGIALTRWLWIGQIEIRIFFASLKSQWVNIGFTVKNADRVEAIFREKYLIR
ncbi:MAG: hypothetical protein A2W19_08435 [Spirochaetes bacterium RBG_16_49_21]|nr:MAG: hypothetical protein A2W19_08435 [Spirochaetes bacterium RBG_16_49_21]